MDILLIVLTLLQLCVSISTTILGIQALTRPRDYDQVKQNITSDNTRFLPYSQTTHCRPTVQSDNTLLVYITDRQPTVTILQSDNTLLLHIQSDKTL